MPTVIPIKGRSTWTADALHQLAERLSEESSIITLANREPFRHDLGPDNRLVVKHSSGGLVSALEPIMKACSGVWVAHGAGTGDHVVVDANDSVGVPADGPRYRLRRVWLDEEEQRGYYDGFANEGLWPLCHRAHVQPVFRSADFTRYGTVNARFAAAVCEEADSASPIVLVHDYHFMLAPQRIRLRLPEARIASFWHIPFPTPDEFVLCPWARELLDGWLGSSIVGFQTVQDQENFVRTVERTLRQARIGPERDVIVYGSRKILVRTYPVSVPWPNPSVDESLPASACREVVGRELGIGSDVKLGVGIDRLDYTKGICEKFLAIERLLERHPDLQSRFSFVQVAEPSRERLHAYQSLRCRVLATAARINARFATGEWRPIIVVDQRQDADTVCRLLRAADVCYVGSLHDGMNLVAKEFVSARDDLRGVLVLSQFAGAARELYPASIVNPYDVDGCADALFDALTMPDEMQASRMRLMRSIVGRFNVYAWAADILRDAAHSNELTVAARNGALRRGAWISYNSAAT